MYTSGKQESISENYPLSSKCSTETCGILEFFLSSIIRYWDFKFNIMHFPVQPQDMRVTHLHLLYYHVTGDKSAPLVAEQSASNEPKPAEVLI